MVAVAELHTVPPENKVVGVEVGLEILEVVEVYAVAVAGVVTMQAQRLWEVARSEVEAEGRHKVQAL